MYQSIILFITCILLSFGLLAQKDFSLEITQVVEKEYPALFELYKDYHQMPELSFMETNTAKKMAAELERLGFDVQTNIGGTGVAGIFKNGEGPTILVRADMDALPIIEETNLPYASKVKTKDQTGKEVGVMHACGHDIHMTVWAGTARTLVELKDKWRGTLFFIAQPAEERGSGARMMLNDGLFEKFPVPDFALALHVKSSMAAGKVGYCPKYAMANVDMVDITIYGEGGHGAYPHTTKDPIVLAARLIMDLQTIVSREISPLEPAVVTVGSIHGGSKGNVIPDEVKLELTLRSYTDEVRNALIEKIERMCKGLAISADLPEEKFPKVYVREEFVPSLYNDPELTHQIGNAFRRAIGEDNVSLVPAVMGGEDFSRYGRDKNEVPVMLYWLGAVDPEKVKSAKENGTILPSLHSSKFAPLPEPTIKTGVLTMTSAVMELLDTK